MFILYISAGEWQRRKPESFKTPSREKLKHLTNKDVLKLFLEYFSKIILDCFHSYTEQYKTWMALLIGRKTDLDNRK